MKPETMTAFANALLATGPIRTNGQADPADTLGAKVDRLGFIRAQLDQLAREADEIRAELEESGLPKIEGMFYKAGFSQCAGATRIDWQTIAKKLNPSPQLVRAHTKKGKAYTSLLLTAKNRH